jgi:hypothetical protein
VIYEKIIIGQIMETAGLAEQKPAPDPCWPVEQLDTLEVSAVQASMSKQPEVVQAALKLLTRIDEVRACLR